VAKKPPLTHNPSAISAAIRSAVLKFVDDPELRPQVRSVIDQTAGALGYPVAYDNAAFLHEALETADSLAAPRATREHIKELLPDLLREIDARRRPGFSNTTATYSAPFRSISLQNIEDGYFSSEDQPQSGDRMSSVRTHSMSLQSGPELRHAWLHELIRFDPARNWESVITTLMQISADTSDSKYSRYATKIFERALNNRFAIICTQQGSSTARALSPTRNTHAALTHLPTTTGLFLQIVSNRLTAWRLTPSDCVTATLDLGDLTTTLQMGHALPLEVDEVKSWDSVSDGPDIRLLAGAALSLREQQKGLYPLWSDLDGRTRRKWLPQHLTRIGGGVKPHSVREHLRTVESGTTTTVRAHSRGLGLDHGDWLELVPRFHILRR
jgi:hypothetical protein